MKIVLCSIRIILALITLTMLVACGGNGDAAPRSYIVGGTVVWSDGALDDDPESSEFTQARLEDRAGLRLISTRDGDGDPEEILISGNLGEAVSFYSPRTFFTGDSYDVAIAQNPEAYLCEVLDGEGTIAESSVDITVECESRFPYTLSGTVTGLNGTGLVLSNDDEDLSITNDGDFKFVDTFDVGADYDVIIATDPTAPAQTCNVTNATGTFGESDVVNVEVSCVTTPLTLLSIDPADEAVDVQRSITPSLTFSSSIDMGTASTSVVLKNESDLEEVPATVGVTDSTVTLTPERNLRLLTSYLFEATDALEGTDGEPFEGIATEFTTGDGSWQGTELVELNNAGDADYPQIVFNAEGEGLAVWHQFDGARSNIWTNRYVPGEGWGVADLIEIDNVGGALWPVIGIGASGNAVAVWEQFNGERATIYASLYTVGDGWGVAEIIGSDLVDDAYWPIIEVGEDGSAVAVWYQGDFSSGSQIASLHSNRYAAGIGWGVSELVDTEVDAFDYPSIALDGNGVFMASWSKQGDIWANIHEPGMGWGPADLVKTQDGDATYSDIAFDSDGNALAVWMQFDGTHTNIWASRYTPGLDWGVAEIIETENAGNARYPLVAFDLEGNAMAVWEQSDGTRYNSWANRYLSDTGWSTAELIETDNVGDAVWPQIALDNQGNGIAIWAQWDEDTLRTWANRFVLGSGWGTAEIIDTDIGDTSIYTPQISFDGEGNAVAVWAQNDGARTNIYSNRFE